jgi:hypothetical protein
LVRNARRNTILKTKALLGALVVAVLAVFGVIGLRNAPDASAGDFAGATSFNPGTVLVGGSASSTITFYDDRPGTSSMMASAPGLTYTASSAVLASNATVSCAVSASGLGTSALTLVDTGCDANTTSEAWLWTVTVTCTTAGTYTVNFAPAGFTGSIYNGTASSSVQPLQCVTSSATGTNTLTIRKVDQFGQPLLASFSIQQGPFWVEVARVNLGPTSAQNPCATDGTGGASCALTGVITPNVFTSGLPNGTYRVVEIAGPNSYCTLVGVYNGFSYTTGAQGAVNNTFWGSPLVAPYQITLPDANPLDLQLTFVNSCIVPGGPFAGTSGIAVVIGGSTAGLTNTANLETNPAPGSDSNARLDIRIRDSASIPIPNAHVTVLIDKGTLAMRRDLSSFPNGGYEVIEPVPGVVYFGSNIAGDTCDQATNGWWTQSATTGSYSWPFSTSSRTQQDGYTNTDGILSACVYVDSVLAPNTTPGKINVQAIVESPNQGGLYNGSTYYNPLYPSNLSLPNYLASPNIVLTATITVVGPPASITVAAAPTSLNCGEKATITVTVKDSAGQNVSDHTRVELVTNFGGVLGGTTATLGPVNVAGGQVFPQSSTSAETFNGVATAYLLTSTDHVGPYEVVAAAGGSVMATNGAVAPWYNTLGTFTNTVVSSTGAVTAGNYLAPAFNGTPTVAAYYPWYQQGLLQYSPSSAPVNAQATVTCAVPGAPAAAAAAPAIAAPRTGQGPADAFAIRPPNTGDAGLAAGSSSNAMVYVAAGVAVFALAGLASLKFATRR